jgi:RNA polymerase sigma factor (sigma-70 family)
LELEGLQHSETMNEQQLREIMSRYGEDIWNYIYYLTKNSEQADDLAQEVFIKCYYRIGTYRGNSSFKAWLLTIARNTVFSHRKSRFFRSGLWGGVQPLSTVDVEQREKTIEPLGVARSAEMEYLGNQSIGEIWDLIMALSPKLREILVLDLKYELSIKEIAELMNLSHGTVKSRLHRARQKIQNKLKGVE